MPALVKSSVGSFRGTSGLEGTTSWPWRWKYARKAARMSLAVCMTDIWAFSAREPRAGRAGARIGLGSSSGLSGETSLKAGAGKKARFTTEARRTRRFFAAQPRESLSWRPWRLGGKSLTAKPPSRQEARAAASPQLGFSVSSVVSVVNLTFLRARQEKRRRNESGAVAFGPAT